MSENAAEILRSIAEIILGLGGLGGISVLVEKSIEKRKVNAEAEKISAETDHQVPAEAASTLASASGKIAAQYEKLLVEYQRSTDKKIEYLTSDLCSTKDELNMAKNKISELEQTVKRYGKRITYLMTGIQILTRQIIESGEEPCFTPNDWDPDFPIRNGEDTPEMGNLKG